MAKYLFLALITGLFSAQNGLACSGCVKGKGGIQTQSKPTGGPGLQGARVVGVTTTGQRPASFNDGFFNSVGGEGRGASQPVAVPNGDGDDYKVIFK
jgi:hypothetical protein